MPAQDLWAWWTRAGRPAFSRGSSSTLVERCCARRACGRGGPGQSGLLFKRVVFHVGRTLVCAQGLWARWTRAGRPAFSRGSSSTLVEHWCARSVWGEVDQGRAASFFKRVVFHVRRTLVCAQCLWARWTRAGRPALSRGSSSTLEERWCARSVCGRGGPGQGGQLFQEGRLPRW